MPQQILAGFALTTGSVIFGLRNPISAFLSHASTATKSVLLCHVQILKCAFELRLAMLLSHLFAITIVPVTVVISLHQY